MPAKDFSKQVNNPGFMLCMVCGGELEKNEDGSDKWHKQPVPCDFCVKKNYGKALIDGKIVDIDPANPPVPVYHDNGKITYRTKR